ncbi:hypothetical protein D3C72_960970 [compost metagenome]
MVSQPVSGTEMALATANEVMTQVPWLGETPRSPEMAGIDTLAIDESSTFMNVASDSAIVPITSLPPVSGGGAAVGALAGAGAGEAPAPGVAVVELAMSGQPCGIRDTGNPEIGESDNYVLAGLATAAAAPALPVTAGAACGAAEVRPPLFSAMIRAISSSASCATLS